MLHYGNSTLYNILFCQLVGSITRSFGVFSGLASTSRPSRDNEAKPVSVRCKLGLRSYAGRSSCPWLSSELCSMAGATELGRLLKAEVLSTGVIVPSALPSPPMPDVVVLDATVDSPSRLCVLMYAFRLLRLVHEKYISMMWSRPDSINSKAVRMDMPSQSPSTPPMSDM